MPEQNNIAPSPLAQLINEMFTLKKQRESIDAKYQARRLELLRVFDKSPLKKLSSGLHTAICKKSLVMDYDVEKMDKNNKLPQDLKAKIINKEILIENYPAIVQLLKDAGVSPADFKKYISVRKTVNKDVVKQLFEQELISLDDIQGCYTADMKRSIEIV
jgi:hypothetical protein